MKDDIEKYGRIAYAQFNKNHKAVTPWHLLPEIIKKDWCLVADAVLVRFVIDNNMVD